MLQNFLLPQGSSCNVLYKLIHVWKCLKAEMTHFSLIIQSFLDASTSDSQLSPLCRIYDGMDPGCQWHLVIVLSSFFSFVQFSSRYMTPASGSALEQVLSMQYSMVTPLLNPLIYSLKNQEVKAALRRRLSRKSRLTF